MKTKMAMVLFCMFMALPDAYGASVKDIEVPFQASDTVLDILKGQVDKYVEVELQSGQRIKGKVAAVEAKTARIKKLSGMEYFDAFIKIDAIVAVIVRTKELVR